MPRQKTNRPEQPCSNPECSNMVKPRRRSSTGLHWCSERVCQNMKQRQYHHSRRAQATTAAVNAEEAFFQEVTLLVQALAKGKRNRCDRCGYEGAMDGWVHRDRITGSDACFGAGSQGRIVGAALLDHAHPDILPTQG